MIECPDSKAGEESIMNRRKSNWLSYDRSEDRKMLAVAFGNAPFIHLQEFQPNEVVTFSETASEVQINLSSGDTWIVEERSISGEVNPYEGVSGSGTDTIVVDKSVFVPVLLLEGDSFSAPTVDVFLASDIDSLFSELVAVRNVSQAAGTALSFGGTMSARGSILLPEAGNQFDGGQFAGPTIGAGYVDIRSDLPISLSSLGASGGIVSSGNEVSISSRLTVPGNELTIESDKSIEIRGGDFNVLGRLNLVAARDITVNINNIFDFDTDGGSSDLAQLNFQAGGDVDVRLKELPFVFGPPREISVALVDENFAANLKIDIEVADLVNTPGMTLDIAGDAEFDVHNVFMANNPDDRINIGRQAFFKAEPFTADLAGEPITDDTSAIWIGEQGDVRFGWFRSENSTYVTVHEDDSTFLTVVGGNTDPLLSTRLINIKSDEGIYLWATAQIESTWLTLEANGEIRAQFGEKILKGQRVHLRGSRIDLDHVDGDKVNFQSPGFVTLTAPRNLVLIGDSTAKAARLSAAAQIATVAFADLETGWLEMNAQSIWLANHEASDRISVSGQARFHATDYVVLGRQGTVEAGSMNIQTQYAEVIAQRRLVFFGDNVFETARLQSTGNILDLTGTRFEISRRADFTAPAVYLADQSEDKLEICGHVNFNVTRFASVHRNGDVKIGTWRTTSGGGSWIIPDSRECD